MVLENLEFLVGHDIHAVVGTTGFTEERLEKAARTIAADRQNVGQLVDRIYAENLARIFKEQAKPTVEKVSAKEFAERAKA